MTPNPRNVRTGTALNLSYDVLALILKGVTYKPDYTFALDRIIANNIDGEDIELRITAHHTLDSRDENQLRRITIVHPTLVPLYCQTSREAFLSFVRNCLNQLEIHEMDEWLQVDGELLNDPHRDDAYIEAFGVRPTS